MRKKLMAPLIFVLMITALYFLYKGHTYLERLALPGIEDAGQVGGIRVSAFENDGIYTDIYGYKKDGGYYLFVPTRADISKLVFYVMDDSGRDLERVEHDFSSEDMLLAGEISVRAMRSDLPTLEITLNSESGGLTAVESSEDHSYIAGGDMVLSCTDETAAALGCESVVKSYKRDFMGSGSMELKGHGNASWLLDKKSYNISLDIPEDLLGMGEAVRWVLLANAVDLTLIRNEAFLRLAENCQLPYSLEMRQVDLFIDGEYRGCYSLAEKAEAESGRVDIAGGHDFLYRWGLPGPEAVQLPIMLFRDELTNVVEVRNLKDISQNDRALALVFTLARAICDTKSRDFFELADKESWARYYWVQEFSKNTDATSRSFYTVWLEDEQKMVMGPVWDMDQTAGDEEPYMRPADYLYPTEWAVRLEELYVPLFERDEFREEVDRVYLEGGIREALDECVLSVPEIASRVRASAEMNFIRWDVMDKEQNNQIVRWMGESTLDTQNEWLESWLMQRAEWIKEQYQ